MTTEAKIKCPVCQGKKKLPGECICDMEWRGTQEGDNWEDCQCTPDKECVQCSGTGYVETVE